MAPMDDDFEKENIMRILAVIFFFIAGIAHANVENISKDELIGGLYSWAPYQFIKPMESGNVISGMDIGVASAIADIVGARIKLQEVSWKQHQIDIEDGKRDIAFGATYTQERAKFAYFSLPYRFEDNSLFSKKDSDKQLEFNNVEEFLPAVRNQDYRLGVTEGYVYANSAINDFINDPKNKDIIFYSKDDLGNIDALLKGKIDGFLADRISCAALVIDKNLGDKLDEQRLNIKIPVHMMFSKKTVTPEIVEQFNIAIKEFVASDEYKAVVKKYLYPVLLLETVNANWFFIVGIIGTISFAISGLAIAARENTTLFGTFIFAMLPSVGGGMLRDIMINKGEIVDIFLHPIYMYCTIMVVLSGFLFVRLFNVYRKRTKSEEQIYRFWDNVLVISDSLGQAAFIVTGVVVVVIEHITPLWLWAPFFAFITANGGTIVRDMMRRDRVITCISGDISAEISLSWGFLFGLFLENSAYNPTPESIKFAVLFVITGAFLTQLFTHYFRIPNIRFRPLV
jgi:polar amino acid transport system substrate-binding protein